MQFLSKLILIFFVVLNGALSSGCTYHSNMNQSVMKSSEGILVAWIIENRSINMIICNHSSDEIRILKHLTSYGLVISNNPSGGGGVIGEDNYNSVALAPGDSVLIQTNFQNIANLDDSETLNEVFSKGKGLFRWKINETELFMKRPAEVLYNYEGIIDTESGIRFYGKVSNKDRH